MTIDSFDGAPGCSDRKLSVADPSDQSKDWVSITSPRTVLFLQGNASRFFSKLATALTAAGSLVRKINFNGGDALFWRHRGATSFQGKTADWPDFLEKYLDCFPIDDVVLFGDARQMHRLALPILCARGVRIWVVEEGYIRPTWITFEREGTNGYSMLPRSPQEYIDRAAFLPHRDDIYLAPASFMRRAVEDVAYHLARVGLWPFFPHNRFHAPVDPFIEYAAFIRRFITDRLEYRRAKTLVPKLMAGAPYYMLPLQLDADYQVRQHSRFGRIEPALEEIILSFASYAPIDVHLVVKSHPLDSGMIDWRHLVERIARDASVLDRVHFVVHRSIEFLLDHSCGLVTINSTVGTLALSRSLPVITLGNAVYDIAGLTFQHGLDRFWHEGSGPDPVLFEAFRRVLTNTCLVHGAFFSDEGLGIAVTEAVGRMEAAASLKVTLSPAHDAAHDDWDYRIAAQ